MPRRRVLRPRALALVAGLALAACSGPPAPDAGLPPGALLVARTAGLQRLLATAAKLEGTPLARQARALAGRLPDCERVEARADGNAGLPDSLACGDPNGPLAALHRKLGEHDLAFALAVGVPARMLGSADVAGDGTLAVSLLLPGDALAGPAGFLLPGPEPAGPPVLSTRAQLLHARVRAGERLDLASFVPPESQAARLFHLESALFSGLVLDGTWEAAVYLPEDGSGTPRTALALGVRERTAAVAAIEAFIEKIRESWPVQRSDFSVGGASGACLLDLNLLPDLAPCYVATERSLVAGWNPASLRQALAGGSRPAQLGIGLGGAGALVLDLARVEEADARLRARLPAGAVLLPASVYPWSRLSLRGERGQGGVRLQLRLAAKESA
ncbi:MAG TPA: hypothetical protein VII72_16970 [Myxococcota bacterium]|jgi:hypothetical protein